jgi:hypothetical protein
MLLTLGGEAATHGLLGEGWQMQENLKRQKEKGKKY